MIKLKITLAALLVSVASYADEGMWLPMFLKQLNYEEMEQMGLQLSAEQIYSVNNSSLKDAIVKMGGGFCTGEIISPAGLMLTNHHCAYDNIQQLSTVENNLLANGFWAMTKNEELPVEGLYVEFLVRMADVTSEVLAGVTASTSAEERKSMVEEAVKKITVREKGSTDYNIVVKPFFEGNEYYLFVYEAYPDVRLVGAPPESIGKFGGDTDNWMWPRHTGDFALYRIYTGPDGKPAPYSPENIPLKSKHHLPISLDGVKEGDFAMVWGFPGSTDRYLTSYGVKLAIEESNPTRVEIRERRLNVMKEDMDASGEVRLKYASTYSQVSNYWKYFIGQTKGLQNLKVYDKKVKEEKAFSEWVKADPERIREYGGALADIKEGYKDLAEFNKAAIYGFEAGFAPQLTMFSYQFARLPMLLTQETLNEQAIAEEVEKLRELADEEFKNYNKSTEQKIFAALMDMYYQNVDEEYHPEFFKALSERNVPDSLRFFETYSPETNDMEALAAFVYSHSILTDREKLRSYLDNPSSETLINDPGFKVAMSMISTYRTLMRKRFSAMEKIEGGNRLYVRGLREMYPDKHFYPNANSTMRFTYGQVLSYEPKDGVIYKHTTSLEGVMEKEDPGNPEFTVHEKLKKLHDSQNYGQYAEDGELIVGFLTNTDITGGNSGSPVINGKGHLIGTAFDGNWEAMSGDIAFEPDYQRTISVDIRYTLFIIDKFAGAGHLVEEMTLVKDDKAKKKRKKK